MDVNALVHNPFFVYALFYVVSSAVQAMPEPGTSSSQWYIWFHNFPQLLLSNWSKMKMPNTAYNVRSEMAIESSVDRPQPRPGSSME